MASEDSDHISSRFASVHRLRDLENLDKTRVGLMSTIAHDREAECELVKVLTLRRSQSVTAKERDDYFE